MALNSRANVIIEDNLKIKEPFHIFHEWYQDAEKDKETYAPAFFLSTCSKNKVPSGRVMTLQRYSKDGFMFMTSSTSRKGRDLQENHFAAMTFYWSNFGRMICIEGTVEKLSNSVVDEIFQKKPIEFKIWANFDQGAPVKSRKDLEEKDKHLRAKYGNEVPKPITWGGFLLKPKVFEFWQGQTDRIHDRIMFRKALENEKIDNDLTKQGDEGWVYQRLCP